ncbi:MAG: PQQ-binding-like beta-propeller repeat protein [Pseudomonadales bacterium]|nr:PQQ-binding-like beta-propeller repeat protein [Pseudomonadales bacterium]
MSTHTTNKLKMLALSSSLLMLLFSCSDATDTTSIDVATSSASTGGEVETTVIDSALPRLSSIRNLDWRLHNLDLLGSRFSPSDQITPDNVASLTPRWLFQHGVIDGVSNQTTPVIVDGTMYVTDSRGSVYALNAVDGHLLWTYDVTRLLGGGRREGYIFRHRGVAYDDGVVYTAAGSFMFALDAITGEPLAGFGDNGQAPVILDVLHIKNPEIETAISAGYWFTTAPQVYNGVIYVGTTRSESHIAGGYVLAIDSKTGEVLWNFNTVPQDETDQGWDIAGPTWVGNERNGGGIWETPSIDPELGLVYVAVGNPYGDSTERDGMNLFSDSLIALTLDEGRLQWYYQQVHHDVWDYDSGNQPILFDMEVDGQPVKALAQANKNSWLYILNRETGEPVHPIIETPVSTVTDVEGEVPYPTQPIPHKANGERMEPVSPVYPTDIPAQHMEANNLVEQFTPIGPNQIFSPGYGGGSSYSPISHSPLTGLLYVAAIDQPFNSGRDPKGYFSAYDPTTGELIWRQIFEGYGQAGSVGTAGGIVFVGAGSNTAGYFYAYDAETGEQLWKFNTGAGVFASPSVYVIDGQEYVTVASGGGSRGRRGGDLILTFALPERN